MKKPQENIISRGRTNKSLLSFLILNISSSVFYHEHMLFYSWEKDACCLLREVGYEREVG